LLVLVEILVDYPACDSCFLKPSEINFHGRRARRKIYTYIFDITNKLPILILEVMGELNIIVPTISLLELSAAVTTNRRPLYLDTGLGKEEVVPKPISSEYNTELYMLISSFLFLTTS
jgi:hypothetical protein